MFEAWGLGFGVHRWQLSISRAEIAPVWVLEFGIWVLGFGFGIWVLCVGFEGLGSGFRALGFGFWSKGLLFRVEVACSGFEVQGQDLC